MLKTNYFKIVGLSLTSPSHFKKDLWERQTGVEDSSGFGETESLQADILGN
jgi:hypothetical protein